MTLVYFILLVGVLIFVHELGHFLFAKLFGVKVLKFSLGFGPKAVGFRRGETEYQIAWLPLGGFVKMLGEDPTEEPSPADAGRGLHEKPLWQRYIVYFAGPAFNICFPTLIYLFFFSVQSHWAPAVIGKVSPGQPAFAAGLRAGDRIIEIDGRPIRYWSEPDASGGGLWSVTHNVSQKPGERLKFTIERDGRIIHRFVTPRPRQRRNALGFRETYGLIGVSPLFELAQIGVDRAGSAAALAGLKTGDLVTSVNEQPLDRWAELKRALARQKGTAFRVSYLRPSESASAFFDLHLLHPAAAVVNPLPLSDAAAGTTRYATGIRSAELYVHHVEAKSPAERIGLAAGDRIVSLDGKKLSHWDLLELKLRDEKDQPHSIAWITSGGQRRSARFELAKETYRDDYKYERIRYVFGASNRRLWKTSDPEPIDGLASFAVVESLRKTTEIVGIMAVAIVQVIRGEISRDTVGGPVMLAHTARVAAEKGWDHFLWMMALISINLGMLNLLPIPILDGGHILFCTVEAVKRRPLSLRAREIASYIGLFLLISLMVFALKNDIVRLWFK
jgi:regulator of sigma E protease